MSNFCYHSYMNMHVAPGDPPRTVVDGGLPGRGGSKDPRRDAVVRAFLRDAEVVSLGTVDLEEQRAGNRAIIASRLEMIWGACEPHITGVDSDGAGVISDYRYVDLGARVLDRLAKVLQVHLPDVEEPVPVEAGRSPHAVTVARSLEVLEGRFRGGVVEGG